MSLCKIRDALRQESSKEKAKNLQRFFKTGKGEYAEGDRFIGVMVPAIRCVVKQFRELAASQAFVLLKSKIHEERLTALLILVGKFSRAKEADREKIFRSYLASTRHINNWDLVDLSAPHIVGAHLMNKNRKIIFTLATSESLWERRIAVLATFYFIRENDFGDAFRIAERLLSDRHDLIHKAVGWMLREIGKRDCAAEENFLKKHYRTMPRTMLRYAIERFSEAKRKAYLKGTIEIFSKGTRHESSAYTT